MSSLTPSPRLRRILLAPAVPASVRMLRLLLLARMVLDQQVRLAEIDRWPTDPAPGDEPLQRLRRGVDEQNTAWLRVVISIHGWPGRALVGDDGAQAAWLFAQHADHDPAFQQHCLRLLRSALDAGDADPILVAYLHDRVALHADVPQMFGTQHTWDEATKRFVPSPIADPETIDARRAEVGLGPLAEYTKTVNDRWRTGDHTTTVITDNTHEEKR